MDAFDTIGSATPSRGGNYLRDGIYKFAVEKMLMHRGNDGPTFVAELRVLESAPAEGGVEPNAVGTTVSYAQILQKFKSAPGNARSMVIGVAGGLGYAEHEVDSAFIKSVCGEDQPLRGATVKVSTYRKPTRDGSKTLTLPNWQSVSQEESDIVKMRAFLDSTAATSEETVAATPAQETAKPAGGGVLSRLGKR